jgi:hypothetical protein
MVYTLGSIHTRYTPIRGKTNSRFSPLNHIIGIEISERAIQANALTSEGTIAIHITDNGMN